MEAVVGEGGAGAHDGAAAGASFHNPQGLASDETSRAHGHDYVTTAADVQARRVVCVSEGRASAAYIKGVTDYQPEA